ncbi:MAG: flagellar protein [Halomonadaceae bacterium T82-2]|nr:MAG: flagellar protein [Halomonadaceae bacterium T82-2]
MIGARRTAACLLLVGLGLAGSALGAGSWVGRAPAVNLGTPGRVTAAEPITPPAGLRPGLITSVSWRFRAPPGLPDLEAWLCHPRRCLPLTAARGRSDGLRGLPAREPLTLHFRLPRNAHAGAVRLTGLQVIVNYREPQKGK